MRSGRCKGFKPATGDGFAFHPHGVLTAPDKAFPHPDDVSLASLPRLESALDKIQRVGGLKATTSRFNLYIDEYGYQTNPPDRISGVSASTQNAWLQRAAYQAWRDPRVKLFTQYLWRDEPDGNAGIYSGWQSGLHYLDGRAEAEPEDASRRRSCSTPPAAACGARSAGATRAPSPCSDACAGARPGARSRRARPTPQGYWSWTTKLVKGAAYRYTAGASGQRDRDAQVSSRAGLPRDS